MRNECEIWSSLENLFRVMELCRYENGRYDVCLQRCRAYLEGNQHQKSLRTEFRCSALSRNSMRER